MIVQADARHLPLLDGCVQCVVTSPPYFGLRDYGVCTQIGLESTVTGYVAAICSVFREIRRVLAGDGTVWLNLGDSYNCSPRGNAPGELSTSSLTNPKRQDRLPRPHGATSQRLTRASIGKQLGNNNVRAMKPKDLLGIPWAVAFALRDDGWYLRSDIIWHKPNPMPESVTDRPTKAHEYLFLLSKSERYYYDAKAIYEPYAESTLREAEDGYDGLGLKDYEAAGVQNPSDTKRRIIEGMRRKNDTHVDRRKHGVNEWDKREYVGKHGDANPQSASRRMLLNVKAARDAGGAHDQPFGNVGRNKRSVWTIPTMPYAGAHFATMPEALVEPCILAGSRPGDLVLDPFLGSGTVGAVAERLMRRWVGTDLSYHDLAKERTAQRGLRLAAET